MNKKIGMITGFAVFATVALAAGSPVAPLETDEAEIEGVILHAYIEGVHLNRDAEAMRGGFHPDFVMTVQGENGVNRVTLDQWAGGISRARPQEREITWDFVEIDVTGTAAIAKVAIFQDGTQIYTDYLGLYKFEDGWRIVTKTFFSH